MHSIFAIEPEAINNWSNFRYIVEKFGYSKGLLIARYPKKWGAMVLEAARANKVGDIEFARMQEKLKLIKGDRLYKAGFPYDPSEEWKNNATLDDIINQLEAVLTKEEDDAEKIHSVTGVDENLFENRRELAVKRDADSLANAAKYLINESRTLTIVDPYFQSRGKCLKVLSALLHHVKNQCDVVIHTAHSKCDYPKEQFERECNTFFNSQFDHINVTIVRWSDDELDFDLHARYLITSIGGLRFDRGFVEPPGRDERKKSTDIVCMDIKRKDEVLEQFSDFERSDGVIDYFRIL